MTVALAWIGTRPDGHEELFVASDSRVRGGRRFDACPKILALPRSDCTLCFAGETDAAYPLMLQLANAIAAHQPARERSLDISKLLKHLLRVFTDLFDRFEDETLPVCNRVQPNVQLLFAGYSWLRKQFCIWTIYYSKQEGRFAAREAVFFDPQLRKAAFIGDRSRLLRSMLAKELQAARAPVYLEPLTTLARLLESPKPEDSIGGPPQLVRIAQHMSTVPLCVRWRNEDTLFGRPLFPYENTDYLIVDPFFRRFIRSRKFGRRVTEPDSSAEALTGNSEDNDGSEGSSSQ